MNLTATDIPITARRFPRTVLHAHDRGFPMPKPHHLIVVFSACLASLLAGCTAKMAPEPLVPPLDDHIRYFKNTVLAPGIPEAVSGISKMSISAGRVNRSFKALFALKPPGRLRIEILGFMNKPALYIVSDGHRFEVFDPAANCVYEGFASASAMKIVTGLRIHPSDIVLLLMGAVPESFHAAEDIFYSRTPSGYSFSGQLDGQTATIRTAAASGRILHMSLRDSAEPVYQADYEYHDSCRTCCLPDHVVIHFNRPAIILKAKNTGYSCEKIDDSSFSLPPLPGSVRVPLSTFQRGRLFYE